MNCRIGKRSAERIGIFQSSDGAVLVLAALLIIVIIFALGLALDTATMTSSQTDKRKTAEAMALAGLEEFLDEANKNADPSERPAYVDLRSMAVTKAERIGGLDWNKMVGDKVNEQVNSGEIGIDSEGISGQMEFGYWWFSAPATCSGEGSPCPCEDRGDGKGLSFHEACFEPNSGTADTLVSRTNAVRVKLWTRASSGIVTNFARVIGMDQMGIAASSTATVVPRNGVFLVDLSRSMQFQSHLTRARVDDNQFKAGASSEYAYQLDGLTCVPSAAQGKPSQCLTGYTTDPTSPPWCPIKTANPSTQMPKDVYAALGGFKSDGIPPDFAKRNYYDGAEHPNGPADPTLHYNDDYECVPVTHGGTTEYFLVDTFFHNYDPDPNKHFTGPEPLNSVLRAIDQARKIISARSVPSDRIGVIGFDKAADTDVRRFTPAYPITGNTDYERLKRLTDVDEPRGDTAPDKYRQQLDRARDFFFFPTIKSDTDLPGAIDAAKNMLTRLDNFQAAQNFIALFSDGLTTCSHTSAHIVNSETADNCQPSGSQTAYDVFVDSMYETTGVISRRPYVDHVPETYQTLKDLGIVFHMFPVGDAIAPNTTLMRIGSGDNAHCADGAEAATSNYPFTANFTNFPPGLSANEVRGNIYDAISRGENPGDHPFVDANWEIWKHGVSETGGIWAPLRPPCDPTLVGISTSECNEGKLKTYFDSICKNAPKEGKPIAVPPYTQASYYDSPGNPPFKLTKDFLSCDPQCRSMSDQAADYIRQIFSAPPYIIVE